MCAVRQTGPWVLAATILGSSMVFIDGTVVNVALPVLQQELHATVAGVQWVVEAYALFLAALILVGGSLGDRFGRRRVFTVGVALFTVASVACGLAPGIVTLIIARAVQGVGGALLTPGSLAIISASFSADQRGRAIGTWSGFTSITTALGPVLGGWLVQAASWRWVFFINVPLAVAVLAITLTHVPESRDETAQRLDWPGALLATLGLGALVFGLITSSARSLGDPLVLATILLGVALLAAFVLVERRSAAPMMPLPVFQSRTFSGANLLTLLLYAALSAATFFFPFNLIQVQGYPPAAAGAAFLPFILLMFLLSRWSGGLVARYGAKLPLVIGPLIAAAGLALFAVPGIGGNYWLTFFPAVVVLGLGMAVTVAPLTTAVMGAVSQQHAGIASGINNAVSRTAGLLSIAVFGIVILAAFNLALDSHLAALHLAPAVRHALDAQRTQLAAARIPASVTGPARVALQRALGESYVAGFRTVMLACAVLAVASSACAAALVEGAGLRLPNRAHGKAA
ncbi:MAG TPA: MFS transporter [Ktedonobacterales bacterium]|nr:MFS transporter [Ktedonobacterales bacterium]